MAEQPQALGAAALKAEPRGERSHSSQAGGAGEGSRGPGQRGAPASRWQPSS